MSWVTDVLLICSLEECLGPEGFSPTSQSPPPPVRALNDWLRTNKHGQLVCLDQHALGGGKAFQAVVFGSAFDHFPLDEFLAHAASLSWSVRESVQILAKEEEELRFTLHSLAPNGT